MSSLMTNAAAMTALQTLRSTNNALAETQDRISTGYRVGGAEDNAAYWSIATTMRSDNMALGAVEDALGLGAATIDVMYTSMESTVDTVNQIKAKLTAARQPGVDKGQIQTEIARLQENLLSIAESANFNGENWLAHDGSVTNKSVVSSFIRDTAGAISIQTTDININTTQLFDATGTGTGGILGNAQTNGNTVFALDISALTDSAADITTLEGMIADVDEALVEITDSATVLGSVKKRVDTQSDFVSGLRDAIDRGIGQLVDADMNKESTRLQALQTQQQLGIQALSIANQGSQNILSLFR
ncbi:flagellin [Roseibium denhamense]|uniref:Flagellin n=1 Tax=Roseibium denhamense TaxID=76305 RepID=A0ABY1PGG2_9HYPH|nr:flagellin [Roseibium denhamense]MTI06248.1 flagellin [Roseibium denhamense]SMP32870.1 flagellin [Roseibium denhamense]